MIGIEPLGELGLQPLGFGGRLARNVPTPEDEEQQRSILKSLASTGLSGLAAVGNLLDTPWSMGRDLLAGENPFDQLLSPFSAENRTSGRGLLEKWGVLGANTPGFDWGDVAGLAVDVADPILGGWKLGASALTTTGKLLKGQGLLDDAVRLARGKVGHEVGKREARLLVTGKELIDAAKDPADALSKFKTAAEASGRSWSDLIDKPIGGVTSWGMPFTNQAFVLGKEGGLGQAFAQGMDIVGQKLYTSPPVRALKMLFHAPSGGKFDRYEQALAELVHKGMPEAKAKARIAQLEALDTQGEVFESFAKTFGEAIDEVPVGGMTKAPGFAHEVGDVVKAADRGNFGYVREVKPTTSKVWFRNPETGVEALVELPNKALSVAFKKGTPEAGQAARDMTWQVYDKIVRLAGEKAGDAQFALNELLPKAAKGIKAPGELLDDIARIGDQMQEANRLLRESVDEMGGWTKWIEGGDDFEHLMRYSEGFDKAGAAAAGRTAPVGYASNMARDEVIRTMPAEGVNRILKDDFALGKVGADNILSQHRQWLNPEYGLRDQEVYQTLTKAIANPESKLAQKLGVGEKGVDGLAQELDDFIRQYTQGEGLQNHANAMAEWVGRHSKQWVNEQKDLFANQLGDDFFRYQSGGQKASAGIRAIHELFSANLTEGGVPLADAFKQVGMNPEKATEFFSKITGRSADDLAKLGLPEEVIKAAKGAVDPFKDREWASLIGQAVDKVTQWFKDNVTVGFPSFWTRNLGSGQYVNITSGILESPSDLAMYLRKFPEARKAAKNPATYKELLRELEVHGVVGHKIGFSDTSTFMRPEQHGVPGNAFDIGATRMEVAQDIAAKPSILDAVPGGQSLRRGHRTWLATGGKVNQHVEWYNRVPMYLYLKEKGYSAAEAAKKVKELQFNYSDLAPFEKTVMKRVAPFYTFSRKIAGLTAKTLMERPGGALAKTIVASGKQRDDELPVPEYVAQTASIPFGTAGNGDQRFITGFGLAHEDPMGFLGGGVRQAGLEALSRTNPLIKGPLEWFTGESFFQRGPDGGRDLDKLDPTIGRTITNIKQLATGDRSRQPAADIGLGFEQFMANTPFSRLLTTARTLTDPRKAVSEDIPIPGPASAINLLTGARVVDVPEAAQEAILRESITSRLRDSGVAKAFTRTYVPKETLESLTPKERAEAQAMQGLLNILADRAQKRAEGEPLGPIGSNPLLNQARGW